MSDYPPIAVLLITYGRPKEIRITIDALVKHLHYDGRIAWHIADDGSPKGYVDGIKSDYPDLHFTSTITPRKGWGVNANTALKFLNKYKYIFLNEDDYKARRKVNLTLGVSLLQTIPDICIVRYDGLYAHDLDLLLRRAQDLPTRPCYLRIVKSSPHNNVYSNRPHLRDRARVLKHYGSYSEGRTLAKTEQHFARRLKKMKGPDVVALTNGVDMGFIHIAEKSWKNTKHDIGSGRSILK